jgi:hypothetical protein
MMRSFKAFQARTYPAFKNLTVAFQIPSKNREQFISRLRSVPKTRQRLKMRFRDFQPGTVPTKHAEIS